uniref:uncharacterized protein LOC124066089 isoform X2 n=1 Tax=Scatophagus argus TaxID=75038 RepID=UPI001ED82E48|nr:uncharacterized protein LOC124066089 isoform X2 [Scatophagus argus]
MAGTQLLRLLVRERLAAAAEEIFGLVEKTIAEYQEEAVRSKTEVIQLKRQLEQLTVLKPEVIISRAGLCHRGCSIEQTSRQSLRRVCLPSSHTSFLLWR